jgi:hypothetical protein
VAEVLVGLFLVSEDLPEIGEVDGGALAAVVGITINVEYFLAWMEGGVPSWERRPERMHSMSPVPQTTTSYVSFILPYIKMI